MLVDSIKLLDGFIDDGVIETGTSFPPALESRQGQLFYLRSGDVGLYTFDGVEWTKPANSEGGGSSGGGDSSSSWMGGEPNDSKERLGLTSDSSNFGKSIPSGATELLFENALSSKTTIVKTLIVCNPNAVSALLTITIKPAGVPVALENAIFWRAFVKSGKTVVIDLSSVLAEGMGIYATVDTDASLLPTSLSISTIGVQIPNASAKQLATKILTEEWEQVYTAPENKTCLIYQVLAANGSDSEANVSFQIVPTNGQVDPKNIVLSEVALVKSETLMFTTVLPIPSGFSLYAKASKPLSVNMTLDGTEK